MTEVESRCAHIRMNFVGTIVESWGRHAVTTEAARDAVFAFIVGEARFHFTDAQLKHLSACFDQIMPDGPRDDVTIEQAKSWSIELCHAANGDAASFRTALNEIHRRAAGR